MTQQRYRRLQGPNYSAVYRAVGGGSSRLCKDIRAPRRRLQESHRPG